MKRNSSIVFIICIKLLVALAVQSASATPTLYYLSEAYIKNKEYKKALNKLLPYVIEHKDHRLIIKISEAAYRLNETSLGHEYKGDYLKMIGSLNSAAKFYRLALKYNMKGRMIDQRINSKLKSIDKIRESKDIL